MSVVPIRSLPKMATEAEEVGAKLRTHEAVCAERYEGINAQLRRMEKWFVTLITAIMGVGVAIILKGGM